MITDSPKHPWNPLHFVYLMLFKGITGKLKQADKEAALERLHDFPKDRNSEDGFLFFL